MSKIYTIGYGNRSINLFINLLNEHNITTLIDVRCKPYSRFNKAFSKNPLAYTLESLGIRYLYMGDTLGGKPQNKSLFINDKINYEAINLLDSYQTSISEIIAVSENENICLMCCELNPEQCHRKTLIGETLLNKNIQVMHINKNGNLTADSFLPKLFMF
jgi:uncharacterized protein (DUF488 family)